MTDPNDPNNQQPSYGQQPPFGQQPSYGQQPPPPGQQPYGSYPSAPQYSQQPVTSPNGLVLDQASGLYLPPGTQLAPVGRRIGAYFLSIVLFIVTLGIGFIIWGLILWGQGRSPAFKVLGMRVYKIENGTVASFGRMALRDILGAIVEGILSLITQLISFIMFLTGAKRQTLRDLVAGTVVLYDPNNVLG